MELPAPGQIFQRKYKLQEILGRGGFAAVYRATDVEIGRDVAIKVLAPGDDGYSTGIASRFMREARVIGGFQDPHTITMFEFGRSDDGLLFMVFEYVRGDDLSKIIRKRGPLPQQDVIHILKQVLQSLREAHAHSVLHRDIKPANILVYDYMGDSNRVKLLDFGIAKAVAGDEAGINLTREGAMIGTPRYMSPEQIYGGDLNPRSDLYSLGLVAHEMLVGRPAITGTTSKEMLRAQLADDPVRLPRDKVLATEAFCSVIDRMTARNPDERFEDAAEVMQALDWLEKNDADAASLPQSGPLQGMAVSGYSPAYQTPSGERSRSGEHAARSGERSWDRSGPLPGQHSGPLPGPHAPMGADRHPGPHSGALRPHQSGPMPGHPSGPMPGYPGQHTPRPADNSGSYGGPDDSVPPSTERPRTFEEEDEGDISLGTVLGAGLGAAALVVGLLMLMSFLASRDDAPAPEPPELPVPDQIEEAQPEESGAATKSAKGEGAAATATPDQGVAADLAVAAAPKASGCAKKAPWRGENTLSVNADSGTRKVFAYLPINYSQDKKYPVVLMFHSMLKDGADIVNETQFKRLADDEGFVIIAPNAGDPASPWVGDDSGFIKRAVDEVAALACVDRSRIFAVGHGSGSKMARDLPCRMPLSGTAITGHGLKLGESLCTPAEPVPTIRMHGKLDRYSPFRGGAGCLGTSYHGIDETEERWRARNECAPKASQYLKKGAHVCFEWKCAQPFVSCHLEGGHDWSTFQPEAFEMPGCVAEAPDFPVGPTIWKFFETHGRELPQ